MDTVWHFIKRIDDHVLLNSTSVTQQEKNWGQSLREAAVCLYSFARLCRGLLLPLSKPSQQLQLELPKARASSWIMTSQALVRCSIHVC